MKQIGIDVWEYFNELIVNVDMWTRSVEVFDYFEGLLPKDGVKHDRIIVRQGFPIYKWEYGIKKYTGKYYYFVIERYNGAPYKNEMTFSQFKEFGIDYLVDYAEQEIENNLLSPENYIDLMYHFSAPFLIRAQNSNNRNYGHNSIWTNGKSIYGENMYYSGKKYGATTGYMVSGVYVGTESQYYPSCKVTMTNEENDYLTYEEFQDGQELGITAYGHKNGYYKIIWCNYELSKSIKESMESVYIIQYRAGEEKYIRAYVDEKNKTIYISYEVYNAYEEKLLIPEKVEIRKSLRKKKPKKKLMKADVYGYTTGEHKLIFYEDKLNHSSRCNQTESVYLHITKGEKKDKLVGYLVGSEKKIYIPKGAYDLCKKYIGTDERIQIEKCVPAKAVRKEHV